MMTDAQLAQEIRRHLQAIVVALGRAFGVSLDVDIQVKVNRND